MNGQTLSRTRYRQRLRKLVRKPPTGGESAGYETEVEAHWAKYICVLISGFIERAIKEILLEHAHKHANIQVYKYIEDTWPKSTNMKCDVIARVLGQFDKEWQTGFEKWLNGSERKKEINEIVKWRNAIAHGKEEDTNNVTLASVASKFKIACDLIDFIEKLLQ